MSGIILSIIGGIVLGTCGIIGYTCCKLAGLSDQQKEAMLCKRRFERNIRYTPSADLIKGVVTCTQDLVDNICLLKDMYGSDVTNWPIDEALAVHELTTKYFTGIMNIGNNKEEN